MRAFWQKLYDYNADVVLNGHDHSYARYAPLNRDANGTDAARGIRQIVAGTGGKGLTTATRAGSPPCLEVQAGRQYRKHPGRSKANPARRKLRLAVHPCGGQELLRLREWLLSLRR